MVRLVANNGIRKIITMHEAKDAALKSHCELVLIANNDYPTYKLINKGKEEYKKNKIKKKNKKVKHKTLKISSTCGENDLKYKLKKAQEIIDHGDKLTIILWRDIPLNLKGKESRHTDGRLIYSEWVK